MGGVQVGRGEKGIGEMSVQSMEEASVQTFSNLFQTHRGKKIGSGDLLAQL